MLDVDADLLVILRVEKRQLMQVDLYLEGLTNSKLVRLTQMLEALVESKRSEAFNHFMYWTIGEARREIRSRLVGLPLRHVVNVNLHRMRPGEVVFLRRQLRDWEAEFGEYTMGQLADLFWQASVSLCAIQGLRSMQPALPN